MSNSEAGKSKIGTIIGLLVVGAIILCLFRYLPLRYDNYELEQFVAETLKYRGTKMPPPDEGGVRYVIHEKTKEMGLDIPIEKIEIIVNEKKWRCKIKYKRTFEVPGYKKVIPYAIDQSWSGM